MIKIAAGNWAGWPTCPRCQARREAQCSVCLARGTDFQLADFEEPEDAGEGDDGADVLLLCSTCDEPLTPRFYRVCTHCGFDFGEGLEHVEMISDQLTSRAILVMVGAVLLVVGLLGFFALVLHR